MDMVGHQAPAEQPDSGMRKILLQQPELRKAVVVRGKGLAAVHSALRDVTGNSGEDTTIAPRHMLD